MKITESGVTCTAGELATMLGLSVTRLQQLASEKTITKLDRGLYDLTASVRGYCEWIRRDSRGSSSSSEEKKERIRLTKAKATLAELQKSELVGDLLRASDIKKQDFGIARILRNNLQSIPDRTAAILAAETDEAKVYNQLETEIRNSLDHVIKALESEETITAEIEIND